MSHKSRLVVFKSKLHPHTHTLPHITFKSSEKMSGISMLKKNIKKGIQFNVMLVGQSGVGKSTFANTLVEAQLVPPRPTQPSAAQMEKTMAVTPYSCELEEDGLKINLTVIDTPGFGDNIDNDQCSAELLQYVEKQYDEVLLEETRIKRNPKFFDSRIDVCLYFIGPSGHGLRELDVDFMKRLCKRVNIIPVVAKSDSLLPDELRRFKQRVRDDLQMHKITYFQFPDDPREEDHEVLADNSALRQMIPFAIIGAEDTFSVSGKDVRGREYAWGVVDVDNPAHCEFSRLRYLLFNSHLQDLKDLTIDVLYEDYRTEKLQMEEEKLDSRRPSVNSELQLVSPSDSIFHFLPYLKSSYLFCFD